MLESTDQNFSTNADPVGSASFEAYDTQDAADADNADPMHVDPTDLTYADPSDPDVFQVALQDEGLTTVTDTGEIAVNEPFEILDNQGEQSFEFQSHFSDTSTVVMERFPFGDPGAPIPGAQGRSSDNPFQAGQGDLIWAPFQSRRDWVVAHWAKVHSTTSSAVDDFLALPEVCVAHLVRYYVSNIGL